MALVEVTVAEPVMAVPWARPAAHQEFEVSESPAARLPTEQAAFPNPPRAVVPEAAMPARS